MFTGNIILYQRRYDMRKGMTLLLVVVAFVFASNSLVRGAEVIKLKAANYLPVTHPMSLLSGWFCDEVKNRTKGQVEITYHPGGTLLNPVKMYDGVLAGIADLGLSHIQYTRGRFPVMEVFDLPLGFPSGWVDTRVATDFFNKYKPKEWDEVHVLYVSPSGPIILQTITKPVKTLDDIKGLKIRAVGQMTDIIKALGGVPVPLQMPDVYESLMRAVIEGVTVDLSTLKYWKFAEVTKYVTADWQIGTAITFYWVINKKKWDALSPDIQKIFTEVASEARDKQAALWDSMDIEGRDLFTSKGGQMIDLSAPEAERWKKAVQPVIESYKKQMASKGHSEAEVDGWIKYIRERIAYWHKEQKAKKITSAF
jgi:TRAP-type C4-dicarboxylate transport system substrate-binding protein